MKKLSTKFPAARIKKIMRSDDDVGKVAQVTPLLISKALECFLSSMVEATLVETKARNAKKMTSAHVKRTIVSQEKFDFLKDLVENIADPIDEPTDTGAEPVRGKGRGRGRGQGKRGGASAGSAASAVVHEGSNQEVQHLSVLETKQHCSSDLTLDQIAIKITLDSHASIFQEVVCSVIVLIKGQTFAVITAETKDFCQCCYQSTVGISILLFIESTANQD
ncbi:hypothetical protein BDV3_006184 [Batrachochytrium dendrobatidis]